MFTGIVTDTAAVLAVEQDDDGYRLGIESPYDDLAVGESISVSGACLTVERFDDDWFEVFLASETVQRTYLGALREGDSVNLERAMPADGRFDGHVVQGHVDGTAEVVAVKSVGEDWRFEFSLPADLARYVVEKGSITVDGISLTVADLAADRFAVAIIPETYAETTLSERAVGDPVHLEVDVLAKYVERMLEASGAVGSQ